MYLRLSCEQLWARSRVSKRTRLQKYVKNYLETIYKFHFKFLVLLMTNVTLFDP